MILFLLRNSLNKELGFFLFLCALFKFFRYRIFILVYGCCCRIFNKLVNRVELFEGFGKISMFIFLCFLICIYNRYENLEKNSILVLNIKFY